MGEVGRGRWGWGFPFKTLEENAVDERIARVEGVTVETKRDSYWKKDNKKNGSDSGGEEEKEKLCSFFREAGQGWFDWLTL